MRIEKSVFCDSMKSEKTELGGMAVSVERIGIQGIGLIGTILFFLSYQCRSNKTLFRIQFVSYLCYTVHLLLLRAVTGGISYILNTIRSFCLGSKNRFLRSWPMCAVLCALQVAAPVFTWGGGWSVLPVAANIAATIGGYTYNAKTIRMVGLCVNSPLWVIYDVAVGSWAGILDEAASSGSVLVSIARYGWKNLDAPKMENG